MTTTPRVEETLHLLTLACVPGIALDSSQQLYSFWGKQFYKQLLYKMVNATLEMIIVLS